MGTAPDKTEQWIEASRRGDTAAFGLLMNRHHDYAFRLAYRLLGCREESRDVVQESFIKVWQHLARFRTGHRFTTWLYRIVVNQATDRLRQQQRHRTLPLEAAPDPVDEAPAADGVMEQAEIQSEISMLIPTLPLKQQQVFVLRDLEEHSVKETAAILKMSQGSVKTHLYLARRALRQALEASHV